MNKYIQERIRYFIGQSMMRFNQTDIKQKQKFDRESTIIYK